NHFSTKYIATKKAGRRPAPNERVASLRGKTGYSGSWPAVTAPLLARVGEAAVAYHAHDARAFVKALMVGLGNVEHAVGHHQVTGVFQRIAQRRAEFRSAGLGARLQGAAHGGVEQHPGAIGVAG